MTNIFKSNSRFSSLMDELHTQNKEVKRIKIADKKNTHINSFKKSEYHRIKEKFKTSSCEKKKEIKDKNQNLLTIENFPTLIDSCKKNNINKVANSENMNYIDKLKKVNEPNSNIDSDLVNLKPGWVLFKVDKMTNKTIVKKHSIEKINKHTCKEPLINPIEVLAKLYEKRTQEYIEQFGYDEWEKFFKFPDWKEREAWLEKMNDELDDEDDNTIV